MVEAALLALQSLVAVEQSGCSPSAGVAAIRSSVIGPPEPQNLALRPGTLFAHRLWLNSRPF